MKSPVSNFQFSLLQQFLFHYFLQNHKLLDHIQNHSKELEALNIRQDYFYFASVLNFNYF
jgi:hypothetical protein